MKTILYGYAFLFLVGCASDSVSDRIYLPNPNSQVPAPRVEVRSRSQIDYTSLQRDLGLDHSFESLGYYEKKFDTCQAGYGFSNTQDCRNEFFVVINFQLLCRDSEGTISTALETEDMKPISSRPVSWNLRTDAGVLRTNSEGFGQIRTVASTSQKQQRLKLTVGPEFLYMKAGEINRIVTPQPWCNP